MMSDIKAPKKILQDTIILFEWFSYFLIFNRVTDRKSEQLRAS